MKIMVVSEGQHESGAVDREGALPTLIERIIGHPVQPTFRPIADAAFRARGYEKRTLRCFDVAKREGFDAVVIVVDEDGDARRRRIFAQAQDDMRRPIARAMGIAIRTFDAWMLADETALGEVLGMTVQRFPNPETIRDPKSECARLRELSDRDLSQSELYLSVARTLQIDVLAKRCPKGFAPFAERVRAL